MNSVVLQAVMGCSVAILIFSSIIVFAMKKPLRLWGMTLFLVGVQMILFYPKYNILAGAMISVSMLYLIKGARIFAYRRNHVLLERKAGLSRMASFFSRLGAITKREWLARIISLVGAVSFVIYIFPFRSFEGEALNYLKYTAFVLLVTYYVSGIFYTILCYIVAPLFVIREETRTARLKDALMLELYIGKGVTVEEPYLFFEKEEYYVSRKGISKKIGDLAGYVCEYTVCTDLFGHEFIKKLPIAVSPDREFTELVYREDLRKGSGYHDVGRRLQHPDSSKASIIPLLLGFILPVVLILFTMLLLFLFFQGV